MADSIVSGCAVAVAVIAVILGQRNVRKTLDAAKRESRKARNLQVLVDVLREFRGEKLQDAREVVEKLTRAEVEARVAKKGAHKFEGSEWSHVRTLMHFFDNVGLMLVWGTIDEPPLRDFLGRPALVAWSKLEPFIAWRRQDVPQYMTYFNHLAETSRAQYDWDPILRVPPPIAELAARSGEG